MKRRLLLLPLLLAVLVTSTGCWDKNELNEMAVVIGVGLDKADTGDYEVTAQVIKPSPKQGGDAGGGSEMPTWSLSAKGKTIMDAVHQLNKISPRQMYWSHLQLIIYGEELAKDNIAPVINWFERDRRSRSGTYVVVTDGRAEDLLNQKIELGKVPAKSMAQMLETSNQRQLSARKRTLRDVMSDMSTPGIDITMDVINPHKIRGKIETYELSGVAVLHQGRMLGKLTGQSAAAVDYMFNTTQRGVLRAPCPRGCEGAMTYAITEIQNRIEVGYEQEQIRIRSRINMEGNLGDQSCAADILNPEEQREAEALFGKVMTESIQQAFQEGNELGADIFGIGRELRRRHPQVWHKLSADWPAPLADAKLDIAIETHIRRPGLIFQPTPSKIK